MKGTKGTQGTQGAAGGDGLQGWSAVSGGALANLQSPISNRKSPISNLKSDRPRYWEEYFELLMGFEGTVFEHDPADPGGATKYGIDARSHPGVNIARLTRAGAEKIYLNEWRASVAARLPMPLAYAYFDTEVNAGAGRAAKCLQVAVRVPADGVAGPQTLSALEQMWQGGLAGLVLVRFTAEREKFYNNLAFVRPKMNRFLKGWLARTARMHAWCVARLPEEVAP